MSHALIDRAPPSASRILGGLRSPRNGAAMGEETPVLDLKAVAKICGVTTATVSNLLSDSKPGRPLEGRPFPAPDGRIGKSPWWRTERRDEIADWMANRPGRGAGGGRPRIQP